jgi:hypothetical protein
MLLLALLADGAAVPAARAQVRYRYYRSYSYSYVPYRYSSVTYPYPSTTCLDGAAAVINSQGDFLVNQQQARLLREQARQAQLETRRRAFDLKMYERANRPTAQDERERRQRLQLRRCLTNPPVTEIWSASTLNVLLADLQQLCDRAVQGGEVPLDARVLRHINVTSHRSGAHAGALKGGRPRWPLLLGHDLFRAGREKVDELAGRLVRQAADGEVNAVVLQKVSAAVDELQRRLKGVARARRIRYSPNQYIEARRFLEQLEESLKVLEQPDAGRHFTGEYAARGKNVAELVAHMTKRGLRFAPAVRGDEAAYLTLHQALAEYTVAAHAMAGDSLSTR